MNQFKVGDRVIVSGPYAKTFNTVTGKVIESHARLDEGYLYPYAVQLDTDSARSIFVGYAHELTLIEEDNEAQS